MNSEDRQKQLQSLVAVWEERAQIATRQGTENVAKAALHIASAYKALVDADTESEEPAFLADADLLRKRIESSEQHRTMCVEHGLSDAAIDATYEIQKLERDLVALVETN